MYADKQKAHSEAQEYSNALGLEGSNGGEADAFRHAYTSASLTQKYGSTMTRCAGAMWEGWSQNKPGDAFMDLRNNDSGIAIGLKNPNMKGSELAKEIYDAIKRGELITSPPSLAEMTPNFPPSHPTHWDPLVLDLDGDGVSLVSLNDANVHFDFGKDGFAEKTGWISNTDGFLTLDKNGNGLVDDGTELFGNAEQDGFSALAAYDLNQDGKIDSNDAVFTQLRVWRDADGDGKTDAGEILTLAEAGVATVNLKKTVSREWAEGSHQPWAMAA
jgi:hypothetical protein